MEGGTMSNSRLTFCVGVLAMVMPLVARAQVCSNLGGSPAPTPEVYAANAVFLKYLATGPGGGDDRPRLRKSTSNNPSFTGLDLNTTHSITVTFRRGSGVGPVMWVGTIPAGTGLWAQVTLPSGVVRWTFNDPTVTYGIRKARVIDYGGGFYIVDKFFGANQNIGNAPVTPGVDAAHALVEIYDGGGNGTCYDGVTAPCTGSGNTQKCKAL
jgi:hypothetical protein